MRQWTAQLRFTLSSGSQDPRVSTKPSSRCVWGGGCPSGLLLLISCLCGPTPPLFLSLSPLLGLTLSLTHTGWENQHTPMGEIIKLVSQKAAH